MEAILTPLGIRAARPRYVVVRQIIVNRQKLQATLELTARQTDIVTSYLLGRPKDCDGNAKTKSYTMTRILDKTKCATKTEFLFLCYKYGLVELREELK